MKDIYYLISITERNKLSELITIFQRNHLSINNIALAKGTAKNHILEYIGLSNTEKAISFSVCTGDIWKKIKSELENHFLIDVPGNGICMLIPLSSLYGKRELDYLTNEQGFDIGKEIEMQITDHELIVVICNQGYNEIVMDSARKAGAGGGTVIHAKGTGIKDAEKFLGITLASEKDIVFLVVKTKDRTRIMEKIAEEAGISTKAKAICFSMPVTDTAGLRIIEND